MKKVSTLVALLLMLAMLLCACVGGPEQPGNNTTGSTETSATGSTTDTQTNEDTVSTDGQDTPAELNTAKEFEAFIRNNQWYTRALGCIFEKPEDISAWFYFYNGVGENTQATGEELAFILDAFQKKNPNTENLDYAHNYVRLPVAKMNEALSILGVTVADVQIPDRWVYYDKMDCYYFWVSDAYGVGRWSVTKVEKGTEGIVAVYWETEDIFWGGPTLESVSMGEKMVLTMQQQPDGTYRILSNVPQK